MWTWVTPFSFQHPHLILLISSRWQFFNFFHIFGVSVRSWAAGSWRQTRLKNWKMCIFNFTTTMTQCGKVIGKQWDLICINNKSNTFSSFFGSHLLYLLNMHNPNPLKKGVSFSNEVKEKRSLRFYVFVVCVCTSFSAISVTHNHHQEGFFLVNFWRAITESQWVYAALHY